MASGDRLPYFGASSIHVVAVGPTPVACKTTSPSFAQVKCGRPAGSVKTLPGGSAINADSSNRSPNATYIVPVTTRTIRDSGCRCARMRRPAGRRRGSRRCPTARDHRRRSPAACRCTSSRSAGRPASPSPTHGCVLGGHLRGRRPVTQGRGTMRLRPATDAESGGSGGGAGRLKMNEWRRAIADRRSACSSCHSATRVIGAAADSFAKRAGFTAADLRGAWAMSVDRCGGMRRGWPVQNDHGNLTMVTW